MIEEQGKYINGQIEFYTGLSKSCLESIDEYNKFLLQSKIELEVCRSIHNITDSYQDEIDEQLETIDCYVRCIEKKIDQKKRYDDYIAGYKEVLKKLENTHWYCHTASCKSRMTKRLSPDCTCKSWADE